MNVSVLYTVDFPSEEFGFNEIPVSRAYRNFSPSDEKNDMYISVYIGEVKGNLTSRHNNLAHTLRFANITAAQL